MALSNTTDDHGKTRTDKSRSRDGMGGSPGGPASAPCRLRQGTDTRQLLFVNSAGGVEGNTSVVEGCNDDHRLQLHGTRTCHGNESIAQS